MFVSDGARGVYEDNEICGNRLAGVWVKAGASPIMRRNQVHHGKDAGFFIFDGGMVRKFTDLDIHFISFQSKISYYYEKHADTNAIFFG